ncbi:unnamed protein product [Bursaphelenchus xylophilus]|nr:unnamed protein product [Bursaphelenchus xylophilus]CAG9113185.1 unnamed protein product [Bursaphelenchus xylophilus]
MKFLLLPCLLAISAFGYVLVDNLKVSAGVERTLKMAAEMRRGLGEGKEDVYGQFTDFIVKFEREYKDEQEVAQRFEIIEKSLKRIAELQKQSPTAQFGLTKMADLSEEEFGRIANLKVPARNEDEEQDFLQLDISEEDLPKGHDWRKLNGVSSVKNQGDCGACFAFGTVGAIESQWRIKRNKSLDLSIEQILECTYNNPKYGDYGGCQGGLLDGVFRYVIDNGITDEKHWPYDPEWHNMGACQKEPKVATLTSVKNITRFSDVELQKAVYSIGPVTVAIDGRFVQFYNGGIISVEHQEWHLSHAVLVVGYGVEKDVPYWIVKNSWGDGYGEQGYFRVYRGNNTIGITEMPEAAIL